MQTSGTNSEHKHSKINVSRCLMNK